MMMGAKVVTLSDSNGFVHDPQGMDAERLAFVKELKNVRRGRIQEYAKQFKCEYFEGKRPWGVPCQIALPCATQNEVSGSDAQALVGNGCICVGEGANMPSTPEAVEVFLGNKILFGPGKAANAGGVSVSGLEMTQNSMRLQWTNDEVDKRLQRHHEGHPQPVRALRRAGWLHQLRGWRQHRRLPQSGPRPCWIRGWCEEAAHLTLFGASLPRVEFKRFRPIENRSLRIVICHVNNRRMRPAKLSDRPWQFAASGKGHCDGQSRQKTAARRGLLQITNNKSSMTQLSIA